MTRVNRFVEGQQRLKAHDTEVDCYHQLITDDSGEKLLHLSTFGSEDRVSKPKSSQSLQLNRRAARELIGIIEAAFPGTVASGLTWSG